MSHILSTALGLVEQGLAVFPVKADKVPATPAGFKNASNDEADVKRLWQAWPGPLIGVPTGAINNFDALDIDPRHGGMAWWNAKGHMLPATRIHRTRSGGLHVLFRHHEALRNSESKIGQGVDTRGEGGYVVWWAGSGCEVLQNAPIPHWPDWLLQHYRRATAPRVIPRTPLNPLRPPSTYEAEVARAMMDRALERLRRAPEGQRHYALRAAACTLGGLLHSAGVDVGTAHQHLVDAAIQAGAENRRNAEKTALWGLERGQQSPLQSGVR
jgi:Bifunctional DNA primase/polymerase, N-terminal